MLGRSGKNLLALCPFRRSQGSQFQILSAIDGGVACPKSKTIKFGSQKGCTFRFSRGKAMGLTLEVMQS